MANKLERAKALATEHYSTWGQWVIECLDDADLEKELELEKEYNDLKEWVEIRERIADAHEETERSSY